MSGATVERRREHAGLPVDLVSPRLDEAYEHSALPDRTPPEVWAAAEDFLFRRRLAEGK